MICLVDSMATFDNASCVMTSYRTRSMSITVPDLMTA